MGVTEEQARTSGRKFRMQSKKASSWFTARQAAEAVYGFKVLVDEETDLVLGADLVGPHVDEVINLFALAIRHELTTEDLRKTMFAYPTAHRTSGTCFDICESARVRSLEALHVPRVACKESVMDIRALAFDTGGTVLDWHGGLVAALSGVGSSRGFELDWHAVANDWRRRSMKGIVGQMQPAFNMDDVHRRTLDETLEHFGLHAFTPQERDRLWRAWHELDAWPDFPRAQAALRKAFPVVSFTMLPTSLVVDVSRRNGIVWDAVISCEMIGVYKPNAQAYAAAARWMALEPAQILMVACHNFDLNAAHNAGFRTAFVRRPDEWGPEGPPDPKPNMEYDFVEDGFDALQRKVSARQ